MDYFMKRLLLFITTINIASAKLCDLEKYAENWKSNCSVEEFAPLCDVDRKCFHDSLQNLSARYFNLEKNESISCTFPRILVGEEGFVKCNEFRTYYPCPNRASAPWHRATVCDGDGCNNCDPNQKIGEVGAGTGFKCQSSHANKSSFCVLPQVLLYDNIPDCAGGEDLCFNDESYELSPSCYRCGDGTIIPKRSLCDGKFDCPDLIDECLCSSRPSICDNVVHDYFSPPDECQFGQLKCSDGKCIEKTEVCNGSPDCQDQSDELSKYCGVTVDCDDWTREYQKDSACRCSIKKNVCTTVLSYSPENQTECNEVIKRFDTGQAIREPCWENNVTAIEKELSNITVFGKKCNGIVECTETGRDESECDGTFLCRGKNNKYIALPMEKKCDYVIDCDDVTDESDCDDHRFYCTSSNQTKFVRINQVRNGRSDCEDGSDECQMLGNEKNSYFFNSKTKLIGNQMLYFFVWVMALLALTGNSIVIFRQITILIKQRRRINDLCSLRANHVLVLNLAVADFLMGIYLFSVGVTYETLKGSFCQEELIWKGSAVCTWMGVTALVSCQASVLTLIMLTSCRLYAVIKPFKTSSNPKTYFVILLVIFIWAISCGVAIIPITDLFRSAVPDTVLLHDNPFLDASVLDFTQGKQFLFNSLPYYSFPNGTDIADIARSIQDAKVWESLEAIFNELPNQKQELQVSARYGYYNVHSICIADFFPRQSDSYWSLSMGIIIFNFIAFLYIAAVYIAIYSMSFRRIATKNERSESLCMQGKIFRIIATNFLTWVPICILSFLRFNNDKMIDGDVYQVAAIILLPINSSLNPILYSNIASNLFHKMCGYADDFKKRTVRFTSVDTTLSSGKSTTTLYK